MRVPLQINSRDDGVVSRKQFARHIASISSDFLSLLPSLSISISISRFANALQFRRRIRKSERQCAFPLFRLFSPLFTPSVSPSTPFRINTPIPKVRSALSTVTSQCRWKEVVSHPPPSPAYPPPRPVNFRHNTL